MLRGKREEHPGPGPRGELMGAGMAAGPPLLGSVGPALVRGWPFRPARVPPGQSRESGVERVRVLGGREGERF